MSHKEKYVDELSDNISVALSNFQSHLSNLNDKNQNYFKALQNHKFNNPKGPQPKINVQFDNVKQYLSNYQENFQNLEVKSNREKQRPQSSKIQSSQKYPKQFQTTNQVKVDQTSEPTAPSIVKKENVKPHIPFTSVSNNKINFLNWPAQPIHRLTPKNEYPVLNGLQSNKNTSYKTQFPENQQTLDHKIIKMIKDQQRGIHKSFNPDGPFTDETTSKKNFDKKKIDKNHKYKAQNQIHLKEQTSKGQFVTNYFQNYK